RDREVSDSTSSSEARTTYDRTIPRLGLPLWAAFPLLALGLFFGYEILVSIFSDKNYGVTASFLLLVLGLGPALGSYGARRFRAAFEELAPVLWGPESSFDNWSS